MALVMFPLADGLNSDSMCLVRVWIGKEAQVTRLQDTIDLVVGRKLGETLTVLEMVAPDLGVSVEHV